LDCFARQSYQNRELIVVYEHLDPGVEQMLQRPAVFPVRVPLHPKQPLGTLRNIALKASHGHFFCNWDDDDWHAPRRIELQLRELTACRAHACMLSRWLVLDETTGRAFTSNFRLWEGSLICQKDLTEVATGYPPLPKGEDRELVQRIRWHYALAHLCRPELYVYVYHGQNTWDSSHFDFIFRSGRELSPGDTSKVLSIVGGISPEFD
jgi:glycosyltransferase involved in cell wall biosynthesis